MEADGNKFFPSVLRPKLALKSSGVRSQNAFFRLPRIGGSVKRFRQKSKDDSHEETQPDLNQTAQVKPTRETRKAASRSSSQEALDLSTSQKLIAPRPPVKREVLAQAYVYLSERLGKAVRRSNGLGEMEERGKGYKFYVGGGNNDQLVVLLMKRRWYWTRVDNWGQADFIWTQNHSPEILRQLSPSSLALSPLPSSSFPFPKRLSRLILTRASLCGLNLVTSSACFQLCESVSPTPTVRLYNRLDKTHQLTSKKCLYLNLKRYYQQMGKDVFAHIPLTFLIEDGTDPDILAFEKRFAEGGGKNLWIVKPGENTNCGYGIQVSGDLAEIKGLVETASRYRHRSFLIQKYIESPLLINRRKFDIRGYGLVTCFHAHVQGYFYHDGYLRTSSREFSLHNTEDRFIHLTNDAVQKNGEDYGRYENGNKLSYAEFERFLKHACPVVDFWRDIWTQIRQLTIDSFRATWDLLDPSHRSYTFEILGYDFMVDSNFRVWLIEVNTNPCLALSSAYLAKLIPAMLDNAFRLVLDPYFPEPPSKKHNREWSSQSFCNRFELVFSSLQAVPQSLAPAKADNFRLESN